MITIFNRKELCITFNITQKQKIIETLSLHNIEHTYYTSDTRSSSRASRAHAVSSDGKTQYYNKCTFYVKKEDYEKAKALVGLYF